MGRAFREESSNSILNPPVLIKPICTHSEALNITRSSSQALSLFSTAVKYLDNALNVEKMPAQRVVNYFHTH